MHTGDERPNRLKSALEVLAVVGPIICLIDCVAIPLVIALLPLVGIQHIYHGVGDQLLAFIVLAICIPALVPGFLKHRKKRVIVLMGLGFGLIFFANFAGHAIDDTIHMLVTIAGSICLIKANFDNKRFARGKTCCNHNHEALVVEETQPG